MCCAPILAFLVTPACSRRLSIACFSYRPSLSLSYHVRYFCTAVCPLCNVPASSSLLMLAGALAVIGVLSWTCGPLPPWRLCLLHLSRGYATLHKPLLPPGSQRFGSPMMNLAGMANSIGCLGRRLVSGVLCQAFCLVRPYNVLCTSGHSLPRFFVPGVRRAHCAKHLVVHCRTCLPPVPLLTLSVLDMPSRKILLSSGFHSWPSRPSPWTHSYRILWPPSGEHYLNRRCPPCLLPPVSPLPALFPPSGRFDGMALSRVLPLAWELPLRAQAVQPWSLPVCL